MHYSSPVSSENHPFLRREHGLKGKAGEDFPFSPGFIPSPGQGVCDSTWWALTHHLLHVIGHPRLAAI